ncbi:hypothetical protein BV898_12249 [Hypsibius exemplaris]|uniref:Glycine N-acyltransferase-like protein n=1 Tax=Hypsibius exemplaris TaxID=2072580 RepID=A0A1W0WE59_HYPEX|nr:hypothetical protein BV898_12249 [Hypsibius exemplaris]
MKLDVEQLPTLLTVLEQDFPASLNVYHLARSIVQQKLAWPGLEFYVDAFPDVNACVCRTASGTDQNVGPKFAFGSAVFPYSKDPQKLLLLMQEEGVINWTERFRFCHVRKPSDLIVVEEACLLHGKPEKQNEGCGPCVIVHFDLRNIALSYTLPDGFYLGPLKTEHANQIVKDKHYEFPDVALDYFHYLFQSGFPSVAIFEATTNRPIAYIALRPEGKLGIGFVAPEFRARGFYKIVCFELLKQLRDAGETEANSNMNPANSSSLHAMLRIGATMHDEQFQWLDFIPATAADKTLE